MIKLTQNPTISHKSRNIAIAVIVATLLIIASIAVLYSNGKIPSDIIPSTPTPTPTPTPIPFDFHVELVQTSGSVLQGNSIQVGVTLTYLQGTPEKVTLVASGGPDGATYSFSPNPIPVNVFTSTLTINVPTSVPTNPYSVTVTSTSDNGKSYSTSYTLSVLSANIQVSGTVTTTGVGTSPSQIQFIDQQTGLTYTDSMSGSSYTITLQNEHTYDVVCYWKGLLYSTGSFSGGSLYVYAPVGYTTMSKSFSG